MAAENVNLYVLGGDKLDVGSVYRAGLDNLYTCLFMNFAKYFYWERLLPVAVDCFGY